MKILFLIIVLIHSLIHLLGFVKAYGIKELNELSIPVSKSMGLFWLTAAILLLIYGFMHFMNIRVGWIFGIIAVVVSQFLIILYWTDAKFGTIPNLVLLITALVSMGSYHLDSLIQKETLHILKQNSGAEGSLITESEIKDLPVPVIKWLRHSGAVGRPYIRLGKIIQRAEMKMRPDQKKWMSATAVQYTTIDNPAFIWTVDMKMNSLLHFTGRDMFEDGKVKMLIKLNSLINIVKAEGEKINEGSMQRYLGEMVWFPSLALNPYIKWEQLSDTSAIATMNYEGTTGSGIFYFNSEGDFIKFSTMRYMGNAQAEKKEWVLSVIEYKTFEGIKVPSVMTATWKLEEEDWTWLKLELTELYYNENALH